MKRLAFVCVLVCLPAVSSAQTCLGLVSSTRSGVGGSSLSLAEGAYAVEGFIGGGGQRAWGHGNVGYLKLDNTDVQAWSAGATFGTSLGAPKVAVCPVGSVSYSRLFSLPEGARSPHILTTAAGFSLGAIAYQSPDFGLVPTAGVAFVQENAWLDDVRTSSTSGVFRAGVGLILNSGQSAITPQVSIPFAIDGDTNVTFVISYSGRF